MEKNSLLRKLEKLVEYAKTKRNTLDTGEINDFFIGNSLSPEQIDQIYSHLEGRSVDAVPVLDETMLTEDTVPLDDTGLDLDLDDNSSIKDTGKEEIDLDMVDLLEGIGTEGLVRICLKKIDIVPLLTVDGELDLAQRKADGDEFVKERLVKANLRPVVSIARRYTGRGMGSLDLVQEGSLRLIRGVGKLDYTRGCELSTHTTWQVRQSAIRTLVDQTRTIRVPVHMVGVVNEMSRMQRKLALELGYRPSVTGPTEAFDIAKNKVMEITQIAKEPVSLETPIGKENDPDLGDFVTDSNVTTPEGSMEPTMLREHIDALLGGLKKREHQMVILRLGLEDGHPRTLEEMGKKFSMTRGRARQIEAKALRKLHNPVRSRRIRDSLQILSYRCL